MKTFILKNIISFKEIVWSAALLFVIFAPNVNLEATGETENLSKQAEVVWSRFDGKNQGVYYSWLSKAGWSNALKLSGASKMNRMPCVCSGSDGSSWVAWTAERGSESDLYYAFSIAGKWIEPTKIPTSLLINMAPSMVLDSEDRPWVVWAGGSGDGSGSDIFYSRWNGSAWEQPLRVNKADSTPDIMPLIGMDSAGVPWVSWFGFDGTRYRPYSCKWSSRGWGNEFESDNDNLYEVLETGKGSIPTLPAFITEQKKAPCVYVRNRGQLQSFPIRYLGLGDFLRTAAPSGPGVMEEMRSPDGLVLLCFGDSITQGYPYIPDPGDGRRVGGYEPELERLLSADLRATQAFNWGVGGEKTFEGVNRINSVLSNPHADFILILEGTNDFWHVGWEDTVINLGLMIDKSLAQNIVPILSTLTPDTSSIGLFKQINTTYNPAIRDLAAEKGVILADQYAGLIGNWSFYNSDGLHPNTTGYEAMASVWFNAVPEGPDVTTEEATSVGFTTARLNGRLNPNGSATTYKFEYGTTTAYGSSTPSVSVGSGIGIITVNISVTGLTEETLYHYRLTARNSGGTAHGSDRMFTTHQPACDGCYGDEIVLQNVTYESGIDCECVASISITIGPGVTIENGAHVTFTAPKVIIGSGFNAQNGSTVRIAMP